MNEARHNPRAMAKANGTAPRGIKATDLGDGVGLVGFEIQHLTVKDEGKEPELVAVLVAVGGQQSAVALNVELRGVVVCELGRIGVAKLKALIAGKEPPA